MLQKVNKIRFLFSVLILTQVSLSFATEFIAEGFGHSKANAEKEALEKLSLTIHDKYRASYCSLGYLDIIAKWVCPQLWHASELPLYEVKLKVIKRSPWLISAVMSEKLAGPIYNHKLLAIQAKLEDAEKTKSSQLHDNLDNIQISQFIQHYIVAKSLNPDSAIDFIPKLEKLSQQIHPTTPAFSTLGDAIQQLNRELQQFQFTSLQKKPIFILPPMYHGSREITPLAATIATALRNSLRQSNNSNTIVDMRYRRETPAQLRFEYRIVERHKGTVYANNFLLKIDAAQSLRFEPRAPSFEQKLSVVHSSINNSVNNESQSSKKVAASPPFKGEIFTQQGTQNLLFKPGDTIKLFVRLNKSGYFYIVGHIKLENDEYSYLVDIGDSKPEFVFHVGKEQAGTAIALGEFDVEAPFGTEYLQLFASENNLQAFLPDATLDENLGYHIIKGSKNNINSGLDTVRGLVRNCSADSTRGLSRNNCGKVDSKPTKKSDPLQKPARVVESLLAFTTMDVQCKNVRGLSRNCTPLNNTDNKSESAINQNKSCNDKTRGLTRNCP